MRVLAYIVMVVALATLLLWLPILANARPILTAMRSTDLAMLLYPVWLLAWLWFALRSARAGHFARTIILAVVGMAPMLVSAALLGILSRSITFDGAT